MDHDRELTLVGRPGKLTDEVCGRIITAIRNGNTREASAGAGPVAPSTLYDWLRRGRLDPEGPFGPFAAAVELAELDAERAMVAMWVAAIPHDWRAAAEFLARRFPQRWRRPTAVEVTGPSGGAVEFENAQDRARRLADSLREYLRQRNEDEADPSESLESSRRAGGTGPSGERWPTVSGP